MKDKSIAIDAAFAAVIAARFLERDGCDCENPGPHCPTLATGHYEYLSGDDSVVYEFPLTKNGAQSGYILISGSRALSPVLEFCPTGNPLRETLTKCLTGLTNLRALKSKSLKWRYFGPFDLVAEIELEGGGYYYARLPNLRVLETRERIRVCAPKFSGSEDWLEACWKSYESEIAPKGTLSCSTMFGIQPVKYNQTCESSLHSAEASKNTGPNYCTPSCIAGCVATAWTVLAGSWKSAASEGSEGIFSDAPDWNRDWSSSYGGPPLPAI